MSAPQPLPVVLVGGLHADTRTETVARLLRAVPGSVALHHDLAGAASGTIHRTVRDADGLREITRAPLVNDCACCALREDLVPALRQLADAGTVRMAVVELWDSVEPKAMAEVVAAHGGPGLRTGGVVTAVDPGLVTACLANGDDLADAGLAAAASDRRTVGDTWARQLEYPPVLALGDGGESPDAEEGRALLARLNPLAEQVPLGSGRLAAAVLAGFDANAAAHAHHPACARLPHEGEGTGVGTLVWRRRRPFHPERLHAALEDLACAALRSRGRFWLADRPDTLLSWNAAGGALCVENEGPWLAALSDGDWDAQPPVRRAAAALDWEGRYGDRCQHLVFTSPGLDRDGLEALLDSCLLTDAEFASGREGWARLPAAFDPLLT